MQAKNQSMHLYQDFLRTSPDPPRLSCEAAKSLDDQACSKMCDPMLNTVLAVMATNNMSVRNLQVLEGLAHTVAREHPAKGL